jgi:hypothetical protein
MCSASSCSDDLSLLLSGLLLLPLLQLLCGSRRAARGILRLLQAVLTCMSLYLMISFSAIWKGILLPVAIYKGFLLSAAIWKGEVRILRGR